MTKQNQKQLAMNRYIIAFILASAAVSYLLTFFYLEPSRIEWVSKQYGQFFLVLFIGFWVSHALLSKKHLLNSANTWFGAVITLLFGLVFVWGTTLDLGTSGLLFDGSLRSNSFILGIIVLLFYLPIYCGLSHFNSWISFLVFALEIATFAYYLAIEEPHRMTIRLVNGLRFTTLAIASVQTCGDIYTVLHERATKRQKRKEERERQRELVRVAERRRCLPEEISAMQGYSLNIMPFISYLQTIPSADLAYNRVANDLAHYIDTLLQTAAEKNIEAEELGVDSKVQIHTF